MNERPRSVTTYDCEKQAYIGVFPDGQRAGSGPLTVMGRKGASGLFLIITGIMGNSFTRFVCTEQERQETNRGGYEGINKSGLCGKGAGEKLSP